MAKYTTREIAKIRENGCVKKVIVKADIFTCNDCGQFPITPVGFMDAADSPDGFAQHLCAKCHGA